MAIRRCSLCDGKLNSNNICTFCGLDNSKSDRYARINQSNCDDAGFTHAHEDKDSGRREKSILKQSSNMNGTGRTKTVRDADWEIDKYQYAQKYHTSPSGGAQSTYKNEKTKAKPTGRRRTFGIIVLVFVLIQIISALFGAMSMSYDSYDIVDTIEDFFDGGDHYFIDVDEYSTVEEDYDEDDQYDEDENSDDEDWDADYEDEEDDDWDITNF